MSAFEITERVSQGLAIYHDRCFSSKATLYKAIRTYDRTAASNYINVSRITYHTTFNMLVFQVMMI